MPQRVGFGLADYKFKKFDSGRTAFVSGVFNDPRAADRAVTTLERRGFGRDQITVLMSEDVRRRLLERDEKLEIEKGTKAAEGLAAGGALGGVVGAVLGAIAAAGSTLVVPPLGLAIAGPIAAALAGAGAGGATGGLIGLLVGAGMPEYQAKHYEARLKEGGVVVGVEARTEGEADEVEHELKEAGAEEVKET
jgi:hypothetical protein